MYCECCNVRTAHKKVEYHQGRKFLYYFCKECNDNHTFCPGFPAFSKKISVEDYKQDYFERPNCEEATGKNARTCACCQRKYRKNQGLDMEYNCRNRDCEEWMCTNCAALHQLCCHKEPATTAILKQLQKNQ